MSHSGSNSAMWELSDCDMESRCAVTTTADCKIEISETKVYRYTRDPQGLDLGEVVCA
jgi:hypothetical protein